MHAAACRGGGGGPIKCEKGPELHLAGIAFTRTDGSCSVGAGCPRASGDQSLDKIASLLSEKRSKEEDGFRLSDAPQLNCVAQKVGPDQLVVAWCQTARGKDLSCEMSKAGMATEIRADRGDPKCDMREK